MIIYGVAYDRNTGQIFYSGSGPQRSASNEHHAFLEVEERRTDYDKTHRVDLSGETPRLVEKVFIPVIQNKPSIIADGVDTLTLSGLPTDCMVWMGYDFLATVSNEFHFAVDLPGVYALTLRSPIYLDTTLEITAV